ncbi:MAG: glutamate 5-kinase, partial [Victivallales bacterium]|nr:glutamate 5-kinase [Victivallales bacterium]
YLMQHYDNACEKHGFHCAQLLLTAADLKDRERNAHVTGCLRALHSEGVLPIINENDSVCVDEIKIGDNDTLAAYVAAMVNADLTILLTTIDGFRETMEDGSLGRRISVITELDDKLLAMAGSTDGNQFSTGGMVTKLHAASISMTSGHALAIIDGGSFSILEDFFAAKDVGTIFNGCSSHRPMRSWQRFLAFFSQPKGELFLDSGAAAAVANNNRSLLPSGILGLRGAFSQGDTVSLIAPDRTEIARGIVNFSYHELARICGVKSSEIAHILGHPVDNPEAVHKDYLVLTVQSGNW